MLYSYTSIPVLSLPSILATWIGLFVFRVFNFKKLNYISQLLNKAHAAHKNIICITGAGVSTPSGIPDYASGQWADSSVPICYYTYDYYLTYRTARKLYIDACARFLGYAEKAQINRVHKNLHRLQKRGVISTIITQNVDGLLQKAGCYKVIELHGNIYKFHCLQCAREIPWLEARQYQHKDLLCSVCGGLLKPAVIAYGEPLNQNIYIARKNKAMIIFINDTVEISDVQKSDVFIIGRLETIFPAIFSRVKHS